MRNARIAVLEAKAPAPVSSITAESAPDLRTFAITPASQQLLQACGAWTRMAGARAPSFSSMQVWDSLGPGFMRFHSHPGSSTAPTVSSQATGPDMYTQGDALQRQPLGWIMEQSVLQGALFERLQELAASGRVTLLCPASIKSISLPGAGEVPAVPKAARLTEQADGPEKSRHALAHVQLTDGTALRARLLVGADGAQSRVREAGKIGVWGWEYNQRAVVATVRTNGHMSTAWQRFLPNGPVAILPLWGDLASIVWSTTHSHAEMLVKASPEAFLMALRTVLTAPPEAFASALRGDDAPDVEAPASDAPSGGATSAPSSDLYNQARDTLWLDPLSVLSKLMAHTTRAISGTATQDAFVQPPAILNVQGTRASFPLKLTKANSYVGERVALIGDAAHTVHPLAGQGLNLGLGDAAALADVLAAAAYTGADFGSVGVLRQYERERSAQNLLMMAALDGVKRGFSTSDLPPALREPWAAARNLGMALINRAGPLKAHITRVATGGR